MKEKFETALDVSVGAFVAAAERAREVADELAKRGREARAKQKQKMAARGQQGKGKRLPTKEALAEDLAKILAKMQIATVKDVDRLSARIEDLESKIEEMRSGSA